MANASTGNCFVCGVEFSKTAMKNHIIKYHNNSEDEEPCYLLKIEGAYDKIFWLFIDIALDKPLSSLDSFLRKIWLECCGHMSAFRGKYGDVGKARKIGSLSTGEKILHEYDFGTTTETLITIVGETRRPKQREAVRLLARNIPPVFICTDCGKPADFICLECMYGDTNPFFCEECSGKHEDIHEMFLPAVNSPRMGECGYDGEQDIWTFDIDKIKDKAVK